MLAEMDTISRSKTFVATIAENRINVDLTIYASYKASFDFTLCGVPYSFTVADWSKRGFSKFANPKQVVVVRNNNGKSERYALNMSDTLSGVSSSSFYLRPYDTVYVKQSRW